MDLASQSIVGVPNEITIKDKINNINSLFFSKYKKYSIEKIKNITKFNFTINNKVGDKKSK